MKIGNLKLKNNLVLAPMAGVNDLAFRLMCLKYGAGLIYTGMVSSEALARGNKKTKEIYRTCKQEKPLAIQLFTSKQEFLAKATKIVSKSASIIDLNMGCPYPDLTKAGAGSALLKYPKKIQQLIKTMKNNTTKPITAKIRITSQLKNTIKIAKIIEKAGADALAVHARTQKQFYSGKADWKIIKKIKQSISIPLIANGDVRSRQDYQDILEQTNCDFVMIGRAAIGNPAIFSEILKNKPKNRFKLFQEYYKLAKKHKITYLHHLKTQAAFFIKGMPGAASIRNQIMQTKSIKELQKIIKK